MVMIYKTGDTLTADELNASLAAQFESNGAAAGVVFDTRSTVVATHIPSPVNSIRTNGYSTIGDGGGALYKRVGSQPNHGGAFQSADGAWWDITEKPVINAAMFGVVNDGVTDNRTALEGMRDYMRTDSRPWTLNFNPGTYVYSRPYWSIGINDLTINAVGSTFFSISTSGWDFDAWPFVGNRGFFSDNGFGQETGAATYGFKINTANAGDLNVVTSIHPDSSNFAIGNRVLIYGYSMQDGGSPPNSRYFEINKVAGVNVGTGQITLEKLLENTYDQRWHDFSGNSFSGVGAPRILNLDRNNWNICDRIVINGGYWGSDPNHISSGEHSIFPAGYCFVELNDVKADGLVHSCCLRAVMNNCDIASAETDKVIKCVEFNGGRMRKHQAATGVELFVLRGGIVIQGDSRWEARRLVVDGAHFAGDSNSFVSLGTNNFWPAESIDIRQARFSVFDNGISALIFGGLEISFTISSVSSNTKVLVACADQAAFEAVYRPLMFGWTYQLKNGTKRVRITNIYDNDAGHVAIEGEFTDVPIAGEIFYGSLIRQINLGNIVQDGPYAPKPIIWPFGTVQNFQRIDSRDRNAETLLVPHNEIPRSASGAALQVGYLSTRGWLIRVTIVVSKIYTGASATCTLEIASATVNYAQIDLKTAGIREITPFGSNGSVGADNLAVNPLRDYIDQLNPYVWSGGGTGPLYTDPTQLPKFTIRVEVMKEP